MIDIHSHILPGIDDGARDLGDTLAMAEIAVDNGVTDIIATPHFNLPRGYENYADDSYMHTFSMAKEAIEEAGIPLKLHPGMEIYSIPEIPRLLRRGMLMSLNWSRYLLMEFDFQGDPNFADDILRAVAAEGLTPVIAHIERYRFIQDFLEIAEDWKKLGYVIQCNKGSFQGRFGRTTRRLAYHLMDHHLVDVIASDAHSPYSRTPHMLDVYDQLAADYSKHRLDALFTENPRKILENRSL